MLKLFTMLNRQRAAAILLKARETEQGKTDAELDTAREVGGTHITLRCCVSSCARSSLETAIIGSRRLYRGLPKAPCCAQMPYRPCLLSAYNNDLENRRAIFLPVAAEI
jgi:hypothetical protein